MNAERRWVSEQHEVARNAFLSNQNKAEIGYWYVPFNTGVAILGASAIVVNAVSGKNHNKHCEVFRLNSGQKSKLMTDGVYDCAVVALSFSEKEKVLIHAYGPEYLKTILSEFQIYVPSFFYSSSKGVRMELAYNPRFSQNILGYERIYTSFNNVRRKWKVCRKWVNENSVIRSG